MDVFWRSRGLLIRRKELQDVGETVQKEFEGEAVRLVQTSGRKQQEIAEDLRIGRSTLGRWISRSREQQLDEPGRPGQEGTAA